MVYGSSSATVNVQDLTGMLSVGDYCLLFRSLVIATATTQTFVRLTKTNK